MTSVDAMYDILNTEIGKVRGSVKNIFRAAAGWLGVPGIRHRIAGQ